jgi:hypothetical protein
MNPNIKHAAHGRTIGMAEARSTPDVEIELYDDLAAFCDLPQETRVTSYDRARDIEVAPTTTPLSRRKSNHPVIQAPTEDQGDGEMLDSALMATGGLEVGEWLKGSRPLPELPIPVEANPAGSDTCLHCGDHCDRDEMICISCGAFLDETAKPATTNKPTCFYCGVESTPGVAICRSCGLGFETVTGE